MTIIHQVNSI